MKLRYFGYFIRNKRSQKKFLYNIKEILDAFTSATNLRLKSSFMVGGESLFLAKVDGTPNQFYFVRTSNAELIKRINLSQITIGDIHDRLEQDEDVAFASYVYVSSRDCVMAVASSQGAPRFDTLAEYINSLFYKSGLINYELEIHALTSAPTKESLLEMEVVNSIYVDVDANSDKGALLSRLFLRNNSTGIGSFRVIIESQHGNIKDVMPAFIEENPVNAADSSEVITDRSGIIRVGVRGKHNELAGQLMDYWLDNSSVISDNLNPKAKRALLPEQIAQRFDDNRLRAPLYERFVSENQLTSLEVDSLNNFKNPSSFESIGER